MRTSTYGYVRRIAQKEQLAGKLSVLLLSGDVSMVAVQHHIT